MEHLLRVRFVAATAAALMLAASCSRARTEDRLAVVASFYPLAFAAERIGGPGVEVIDLTPPGSEAHDVELSFRDRVSIDDADLVLYLGQLGFQPQVERAVAEAGTPAVPAVLGAPGAREDPHVWVAPFTFSVIVEKIAEGLGAVDGANAARYASRGRKLEDALGALDVEYALALQRCEYRTMIVSHEAFGHLAETYGFSQVGLAGLSPEGEPLAEPLVETRRLVRGGEAGAIFYEETAEGRRVAEPLANDLGVPALPLATLEARPRTGDYLTAMRGNLRALVEGLGCKGPTRLR